MPSETCNRIRVERYFLGEAGGGEKSETGLHIQGCDRCQEHLDVLSREQTAYLAVHPFTSFASKHLEKKAPSLRLLPGPRWMPALAGAVACLALVAVLRMPGLVDFQGGSARKGSDPAVPALAAAPADAAGDVTYKGGESLDFLYRRDGKLSQGSLREVYRAGDELQFTYSSGPYAFVTLVSMDAQGKISFYRKEGAASASFPAVAGKVEPLPFSVTLDEARSGELFVALFSDRPVEDSVLEPWLAGCYRTSAGDLEKVKVRLTASAGKEAAPAPIAAIRPLLLKKAAT